MYKIYYNEKAITLVHRAFDGQIDAIDPTVIKVHYTGKTKFILACLDKLEKSKELLQIFIISDDVELLKTDFMSLFRVVKASGGLVINQKLEMLMIFRRGSWDLPKGKMDPGETKSEAGVREVQEETGLEKVNIIDKLCTTYHIFIDRSGRRVLKPSYWYLMFTTQSALIPQTEEDIEEARWVNMKDFNANKLDPIFSNIRAVIERYKQDYLHFL